MKTILSLSTSLFIITSCFAQNSTYDELIQKSRKARTTSTILVASGSAFAVGGVGILVYGVIQNELDNGRNPVYDINGNLIGYDGGNYTTEIIVGAAGALVGIGIALSSIHFSNKASDLKREARKAKLKASTERIPLPALQNGFAGTSTKQFKLSLMIPIGR